MRVDEITNLDALLFIIGVIGFAWLVLRLIPSVDDPPKPPQKFSQAEISAYDGELPKYFLAAALALILGGLHTVIKNVPGFWLWLWEAGYGGHLFRDLSNSHIIIVGGGTVLLTAITWYVLPRFVNRPLYSPLLASASFWLTVAGVFGFYLAWLSLGLIEGALVRQGWEYVAAKEALGNWHRIPTAVTSTIMGLGYWTYVLNVFLTVGVARNVSAKPLNYLTKFAMVSAGALFVGTVQGVIQVLPDNADWIHQAGKYGQYVDPISHAHVNLVTGMMVSLALFLLYFSRRMGGKRLGKPEANLLFWTLVPGSLIFYLTFLLLGLILGGATNGYGGLQLTGLIPGLLRWRSFLLALSGSLMLVGFWSYFVVLWRGLGWRSVWGQIRAATPAGFWLISSLALVVGTFQGLLQVIPATAGILTVAEEVPNIHAQLNMIGGVLLALIGLVYLLLPELVGQKPDRRLTRLSLAGIGSGIGGYYLVTLTTGLLRWGYMRQGLTSIQAAAQLGWLAPASLFLTALPMLLGYSAFGVALWRATRAYRATWLADLKRMPASYNGPSGSWQRRVSPLYMIGAEMVSGLVGFPGLGWILSGRAMPGLPMLLIGPGLAWAVVPLLMSPYGDGPLVPWGANTLLLYLGLSSLLSVSTLWLSLRQNRDAV